MYKNTYHTFELKVENSKQPNNIIKNISDKTNVNFDVFAHKSSEPLSDYYMQKMDKKNKSGF